MAGPVASLSTAAGSAAALALTSGAPPLGAASGAAPLDAAPEEAACTGMRAPASSACSGDGDGGGGVACPSEGELTRAGLGMLLSTGQNSSARPAERHGRGNQAGGTCMRVAMKVYARVLPLARARNGAKLSETSCTLPTSSCVGPQKRIMNNSTGWVLVLLPMGKSYPHHNSLDVGALGRSKEQLRGRAHPRYLHNETHNSVSSYLHDTTRAMVSRPLWQRNILLNVQVF